MHAFIHALSKYTLCTRNIADTILGSWSALQESLLSWNLNGETDNKQIRYDRLHQVKKREPDKGRKRVGENGHRCKATLRRLWYASYHEEDTMWTSGEEHWGKRMETTNTGSRMCETPSPSKETTVTGEEWARVSTEQLKSRELWKGAKAYWSVWKYLKPWCEIHWKSSKRVCTYQT